MKNSELPVKAIRTAIVKYVFTVQYVSTAGQALDSSELHYFYEALLDTCRAALPRKHFLDTFKAALVRHLQSNNCYEALF